MKAPPPEVRRIVPAAILHRDGLVFTGDSSGAQSNNELLSFGIYLRDTRHLFGSLPGSPIIVRHSESAVRVRPFLPLRNENPPTIRK